MSSFLNALLLVTLFIISPAWANEKGNGGDPFEIYATAFPQPKRLLNSIKTIREKVSTSNIPRDLKESLIDRMDAELVKRIFFIKENIVLPPGVLENSYGFIFHEDSFVGLLGWTRPRDLTKIYFTKKSLTLKPADFTILLLHEVLHQVLPKAMARDESLVSDLATAIYQNNEQAPVLKALTIGTYFKPGKLHLSDVIEAWDFLSPSQLYWCNYIENYQEQELVEQYCEEVAKTELTLDLRNILLRMNIQNLWIFNLSRLSDLFSNPWFQLRKPSLGFQDISVLDVIKSVVIRSGHEWKVDPSWVSPTCKVEEIDNECPFGQDVQLDDVITVKNL